MKEQFNISRAALIFVLCCLAGFAACKKAALPKSATPEELIASLAAADNFDAAAACYTKETKKAVKQIMRRNNISEEAMFPMMGFLFGAEEWKIVKQNEASKDFYIVITKHASDNMVGFGINCKMKQEAEGWRIDMEEPFKDMFMSEALRVKAGDYLKLKLERQ